MLGDFTGQKVVVTGAAKGIGKGIASVFVKAGADVVIGDIDMENGKKTASELTQLAGSCEYIYLDVTNQDSIEKFFDAVEDVQVLCSNTGIFPQKKIVDMTVEDWDHIQNVNLKSTFLMVKEAIKRMTPAKYGRIVLTSSITGAVTGFPGWSHYGATKAGILGFMRSACLEVARKGITINAVMPGNILTEGLKEQGEKYLETMAKSVPTGFLGDPEDIGNAALFLASAEARYITGQAIIVDGGQILPETLEALPED